MKKIYTLVAVLGLTIIANAQHDLRVEYDNYTNNQVVVGSVRTDGFATDSINTAFTITNDGTAIAAGDTIVIGLILEGTLYSLNLTQGSFNYVTDTVIPNGGIFQLSAGSLYLGFQSDQAAGTQRTLCAYASLVDPDVFGSATTFDATYNGDATANNNRACVTYELDGTVVGLDQNLKAIANKTFVANKQLIIENNSYDFNSTATINVINVAGQVVATQNRVIERGRNTIDLQKLNTGIYFVSIQVEDQISTAKVMVR